jgi:hypothetical protein
MITERVVVTITHHYSKHRGEIDPGNNCSCVGGSRGNSPGECGDGNQPGIHWLDSFANDNGEGSQGSDDDYKPYEGELQCTIHQQQYIVILVFAENTSPDE